MKKTEFLFTYLIFLSLILGILVGFILDKFQLGYFATEWISPLGNLFLRLLKFIAVPIVFFSVIHGIVHLGNPRKFGKFFLIVILMYTVTTIFAINVGLVLGNTFKPGKLIHNENIISTLPKQEAYSEVFKETTKKNYLHIFIEIVPENLLQAASDNSKMIQVIFIAFFIAITILLLPHEKTETVRKLFSQLNEIFLLMARKIILIAPIGVFALMISAIINMGAHSGVIIALARYVIIVVGGLLVLNYFIYPLVVHFFTPISFRQFVSAMLPAQLVAFITSSSALTLPVTKTQVEQKLAIHHRISNFVLPLGMTINMDGTSLYQSVAILFIAQIFGINLSFFDQIMIVVLVLIASIGAPGIPGGSIIMLIMILTSMNLPVEGLALILGVDRLLDMFRTTTNVTGDAMICCLLNQNKFINNFEQI